MTATQQTLTDTYGETDTDQSIHKPDPVTEPPEVVTFTVESDWAHFRRIEGNNVKQTYYAPPRTTVAGLTAAILGIGRDQYYELFARGHSAVAVEPLTDLTTMNMPMNCLNTSKEHLGKVEGSRGPKLLYTRTDTNRQQHNYEVLSNPAYRIHVWLDDTDTLDTLDRLLNAGKSHYTPSLGLSEYLADIEYEGRHTVTNAELDNGGEIDSIVPDGPRRMVLGTDGNYRTERTPGYMSTTTGASGFEKRRTDAFIDRAVQTENGTVTVSDATDAVNVAGQTVIFR